MVCQDAVHRWRQTDLVSGPLLDGTGGLGWGRADFASGEGGHLPSFRHIPRHGALEEVEEEAADYEAGGGGEGRGMPGGGGGGVVGMYSMQVIAVTHLHRVSLALLY